MSRRSALPTTPAPVHATYVVTCPVRVRGRPCKWRSPEFSHDPKLVSRSRALGMWREHFRADHTPVPQVECVSDPGAPHV